MKILTSLVLTSAFTIGGLGAWKLQGLSVKPSPSAASTAKAQRITDAPQATSAPTITPTSLHAKPPGNVSIPSNLDFPIALVPEDATLDEISAETAQKSEILAFEEIDLLSGTEQGIIEPKFTGNGREQLIAAVRNNSPTPYRVSISAGQILTSARNAIVVLRDTSLELMPAQTAELRLQTAALHSSNQVHDAFYKLTYQSHTKVQLFLTWLAEHPEISTSTAQTAIFVLTENLPVSALAKFAPANGIKSKPHTDAFRVETSDLIGALAALRGSGIGMGNIALAQDMQLRIEAMIEPMSREAAKRYYGISDEAEWEFWKRELLQGDPSTRHYALFGIARFYPNIALEMLPKWAREIKTHPVYRLSAVQAIADTQRPDALPLLRQLADEFGAATELGKSAAQAADFLDQRLTQIAQANPILAFRGRNRVIGF